MSFLLVASSTNGFYLMGKMGLLNLRQLGQKIQLARQGPIGNKCKKIGSGLNGGRN
uniref:Uncharacterized protein n=1 Tax=Arundo donax TaxID=35708 RepID=A0A0A9G0I8_ARUDO